MGGRGEGWSNPFPLLTVCWEFQWLDEQPGHQQNTPLVATLPRMENNNSCIKCKYLSLFFNNIVWHSGATCPRRESSTEISQLILAENSLPWMCLGNVSSFWKIKKHPTVSNQRAINFSKILKQSSSIVLPKHMAFKVCSLEGGIYHH